MKTPLAASCSKVPVPPPVMYLQSMALSFNICEKTNQQSIVTLTLKLLTIQAKKNAGEVQKLKFILHSYQKYYSQTTKKSLEDLRN